MQIKGENIVHDTLGCNRVQCANNALSSHMSQVSYAKKDGGRCYIIDCNNDPCVCSKSPCGTYTDGKRQYEHKIACNAALNAKPKKKD